MLPLQITIREMSCSPALKENIRDRVEKLSQYFERISRCRVVIDLADKNKHQGKLYNVRIDLSLPRKSLVVTRKVNEDVYIAIRDAFDALTRQLEEHARKRHGRVKAHSDVHHGHVKRILAREGYGFIEGDDGHEYYFSMTNMAYPNFDQLMIGDSVDYTTEILSEGRHAQHVTRKRNHESWETL